MRITHRVAAVGATVALSSVLALGATGTASAATASAGTTSPATATSQAATPQAAPATGTTVSVPVELAACHRVWHPGAWYWWNHGGWDWRHPWLHRWERKQHPGWWDCR